MISHRLAHKKVLVVVDDADNLQHLKCLVGRRDWFGLGSRILVTTRDEHLLRSYKVDDVYKPTTLNVKESLWLFNSKAFDCGTVPENDFVELSKHVVEYAGGLPLALEVLGCFLCGRDVAQWRSAIERLKRDSDEEILNRLQISFDGLEETEKNIFLDIACFFNGEEKNFVIKVLDGCEFYPDIGIDVLLKKSLIKLDEDNRRLRMHGLLQQMGRKIVRQRSPGEPGKRCRLWEEKDVYHVLTRNTATEVIEGMVIHNKGKQNKTFTLNADAFLEMKRLRLLKVVHLPNSHCPKYLSNELRLLEWHGYPFKSLPSSFQLDNLLALLLPYSRIEQLWKGNRPLYKLKLVNLKGSQNLIKTPNFTMAPNLESLILEGCIRIVDVHPSIGVLKKLKLLNLRGCKSLRSLPTKIGMKSLEELILSDCSNLERFPEIDGETDCLLKLYLDGTSIEELPSSIGHLNNLVLLDLKDCTKLVSIPTSIDGCKCLKILNLSGCSKVENLPENLQQVEFLEELDLSKTAIRKPQSFIFQFKNLQVLSFHGCKGPPSKLRSNLLSFLKLKQRERTHSIALMLPPLSSFSSLTVLNLSDCNLCEGDIPADILCLSSLKELDLSGNNFTSLYATLHRLSKRCLRLSDFKGLKSLPDILISGQKVNMDDCTLLEVFENSSTMHNSFNWQRIAGLNSYRLAKNYNALTMLKEYIKVFANARQIFDILIPGTEIPEWFSHQREWDGSSIKIPLPPNIQNGNQWIGVAFCCVFVSTLNGDDARGQEEENIVNKVAMHIRNSRPVSCRGFVFGRKYRRRVVKDHLWLRYWARDKIASFSFEDKRGETENLSGIDWANQECNEMEFLIESSPGVMCAKVKKCGVRIVYEKDLEEMEEIQEQHSSPTNCADLNDIHQDNAGKDGSTGNGGVLIKRKRNIYEDAGPNDQIDSLEERPHPKRVKKILNFIMGKKQ